MDPQAISRPNIRLFGTVDDAFFDRFSDQLRKVLDTNDPIILELTTLGGDADTGRRIALDLRLARETGRETFFVGKTAVYSAGVTIMAAFPPGNRHLSRDCMLLIHERRVDQQVHFSGPLKSNIQLAEEMIGQLQVGIALERDGFRHLIEGSDLSLDEVTRRAEGSWYLSAEDALRYRLVAGLV
jgi:ATP-dependent protease ClpP protease subunit